MVLGPLPGRVPGPTRPSPRADPWPYPRPILDTSASGHEATCSVFLMTFLQRWRTVIAINDKLFFKFSSSKLRMRSVHYSLVFTRHDIKHYFPMYQKFQNSIMYIYIFLHLVFNSLDFFSNSSLKYVSLLICFRKSEEMVPYITEDVKMTVNICDPQPIELN